MCQSAPWFSEVKVGDLLTPNPYWNQTERGPNHLPQETKVLGIEVGNSQSRVMFEVKTMNGQTRLLDAGWFTGKSEQSSLF